MADATAKSWPGQAILEVLPTDGGCMTVDEIAAATGLTNDKITNIFTGLNRSGFVSLAHPGCYRRTKAGDKMIGAGKKLRSGPRAPHGKVRMVGGLKDKLWRALRIQKRTTIPQMLEIIDHDLVHPEDVACRYLRLLKDAGVTAVGRRRASGEGMGNNGYLQHTLVHDLGRKAPINRAGKLWDPNSDKWVSERIAELEGSHV